MLNVMMENKICDLACLATLTASWKEKPQSIRISSSKHHCPKCNASEKQNVEINHAMQGRGMQRESRWKRKNMRKQDATDLKC